MFDKEKFYKETSEGFKKKKLDEVNKLFGEKETEEKEKKQKEFKGVREGNLRRKANKILANAESEGRPVSAQEQDRLRDLKSKAMSAESRQAKRDERYAESKARTDLKREAYKNKMVKKGIMTAEQAEGRFDNIKNITANSAKLADKLSNQKTKSEKIEENSSNIASESVPTPEELATMAYVDTSKTKIGADIINNIGKIA
jgi:hypothetical protein